MPKKNKGGRKGSYGIGSGSYRKQLEEAGNIHNLKPKKPKQTPKKPKQTPKQTPKKPNGEEKTKKRG